MTLRPGHECFWPLPLPREIGLFHMDPSRASVVTHNVIATFGRLRQEDQSDQTAEGDPDSSGERKQGRVGQGDGSIRKVLEQ